MTLQHRSIWTAGFTAPAALKVRVVGAPAQPQQQLQGPLLASLPAQPPLVQRPMPLGPKGDCPVCPKFGS
jgi:hypothetical protein